jgi:hypothetical protein
MPKIAEFLNSTPPVSRFYSLDALRGIAALSVVASRRFVAATRSVAAAALCAWAITLLFPHWVNIGSVVGPAHLHIVHEAVALWPMMVLVPVTILSLALMGHSAARRGKEFHSWGISRTPPICFISRFSW